MFILSFLERWIFHIFLLTSWYSFVKFILVQFPLLFLSFSSFLHNLSYFVCLKYVLNIDSQMYISGSVSLLSWRHIYLTALFSIPPNIFPSILHRLESLIVYKVFITSYNSGPLKPAITSHCNANETQS